MIQKYQKCKKTFTSFDYNNFPNNILNAKIKEKKLVNKSDILGFISNSNLDNKIKILAKKAELKQSMIK